MLQGDGDRLRICLHPPLPGRQRASASLPNPSRPGKRKFTPPGMVCPVSPVMLDRIEDNRDTLRAHSGPLMDYIDWRPTPAYNVDVQNDTADLYRYFDCTEAAEFLYGCVAQADRQRPAAGDRFPAPQRRSDAPRHEHGRDAGQDRGKPGSGISASTKNKLGRKRREGEFAKLTGDEVTAIEVIVRKRLMASQKPDDARLHSVQGRTSAPLGDCGE